MKKFYSLFLIIPLLMSSLTPTGSIPTNYITPDASGDVTLVDEAYGGYSEGDLVPTATEIDIDNLEYSFDGNVTITLTMNLVSNAVLNTSMTYSITVSIDRYESNTTGPIEEASFAAAYLGGGSSSSFYYLLSNGTTNTVNNPVNATLGTNLISWDVDLTGFSGLDEIFVYNSTQVLLQGYAEHYPGTTTGATNARFYDEARLEWPVIPENPDDDNNPVPFSIYFIFSLPLFVLLKRKD